MKRHVVERRILWGDLDSLGIVFYPRYYEWIDACGHLFFDAIGINLGRLLEERGLIFGLAETGCRYFRAGRYDQRIRIITTLEQLGDKLLVLRHGIEDMATGALMVEGTEKRICLDVSDPERFRAVTIPQDLRETLLSALCPSDPSKGPHPFRPKPDPAA